MEMGVVVRLLAVVAVFCVEARATPCMHKAANGSAPVNSSTPWAQPATHPAKKPAASINIAGSKAVVGSVPMPSGYNKTLFADDFSDVKAGGPPSTARWTVDTGTSYPGGPSQWGTSEVETYTANAANLQVTASGTLLITPLQASGSGWTSARIETTKAFDFACEAGKKLRMQASLRLGSTPANSQMGIWPAFWALGSAFRGNYRNWPAIGELDIFESINGQPAVWQTVHCGTGSGGPCHETNGIGSKTSLSRGDWHVHALEIDRTSTSWQTESLTWLVDEKPTFTVTGRTVGDQAAWTAIAHTSKFLLLNVAIGGSFPNAVANANTPTSSTRGGSGAALEIKDVAVFST